MLVSASIVSLALIGQATRFDRRFITFALVLVGMDAPGPLVATVAAAWGLAFLGISAALDGRRVQRMNRRYVSLFPASDTSGTGRGDSQAVAEQAQA
jgi:hypothetical protein